MPCALGILRCSWFPLELEKRNMWATVWSKIGLDLCIGWGCLWSVFSLSHLCPCISQASTCLLHSWTHCEHSVFPLNPWTLLPWNLLTFGTALAMVEQMCPISVAPVHKRGCLMSIPALLNPSAPLHPAVCLRGLTCVWSATRSYSALSFQLIGFGSGNSGADGWERGEQGPFSLCACGVLAVFLNRRSQLLSGPHSFASGFCCVGPGW